MQEGIKETWENLVEAFKAGDLDKIDTAMNDFILECEPDGTLTSKQRNEVLASCVDVVNLEEAYKADPEYYELLILNLEQIYTSEEHNPEKWEWVKAVFEMATPVLIEDDLSKKDPSDVGAVIYDELRSVSTVDDVYRVIQKFRQELKDPEMPEALIGLLRSENSNAVEALAGVIALDLSREIAKQDSPRGIYERLQKQDSEVIKALIEIGEEPVLDILKSPNFFIDKSSEAWKEVQILLAITGIDNEAIKDIVKNNINTAKETSIIKNVVFNKVSEYVTELNKVLRSQEGLSEHGYYELQHKVAEKHPAVRFVFGLERDDFRQQGKGSHSFKAPVENKTAEPKSPVRKERRDASSPPPPNFSK